MVGVTPRFATARGLRRTPPAVPSRRRSVSTVAPAPKLARQRRAKRPDGTTPRDLAFATPPAAPAGVASAGTWAPCCRAAGYWPPVPPHVALPAGVAQSHDTPLHSTAHSLACSRCPSVRPPARPAAARATFFRDSRGQSRGVLMLSGLSCLTRPSAAAPCRAGRKSPSGSAAACVCGVRWM